MDLVWVEGVDDQRDSWTDMKYIFGSKFKQTWINSSKDLGAFPDYEFGDLFGHALNLGLTEVWIYTKDGHATDQFYNISDAAFYHSFLRKFQKQLQIVWHCDYGCDCDPENPDDWYIYSTIPTGYVREVFP